jgi:hypothetical protein
MTNSYAWMAALGLACLASSALLLRLERREPTPRPRSAPPIGAWA